MFELSSNSIKNIEGVDPRLVEITQRAIKITLVDFGIPQDGGVRTAERQHELFLKGASNADGYDKIGMHQKGYAIDFYAYVGQASWEHHHLAMVGAAHLQAAAQLGYPVKWGGLWKPKKKKLINGIQYGWDMGHIELLIEE